MKDQAVILNSIEPGAAGTDLETDLERGLRSAAGVELEKRMKQFGGPRATGVEAEQIPRS